MELEQGREAGLSGQTVSALVELGFSETEALTYCALVTAPGATAYRLAALVGRSHSNVARALEGLIRKNAAIGRKGNPRTYEPVPHQRLLDGMLRRTEAHIGNASDLIARMVQYERERKAAAGNDEVFDDARERIGSAEETIAFLMTDEPLGRLAGDLSTAAEKVKVAGTVINDRQQIPGAKLIMANQSERIQGLHSGELMILIVDARSVLIMLVREVGGTREIASTDDPLLSAFFHNALVSDIVLQTSDLMSQIVSPNKYLFGRLPSAITEIFRAN